ncbi:MAG TPA: PspC domain-containing protein [Allosphingosinicella sp.]|jgi:phage shock protein PspC (stress-responsive transcriptional regulator)
MATQSVFSREDTLFGVCFALGADFGFDPTWLRLLFAVLLFWSPVAAVGAYAVVGMLVALSRWLAPNPVDAAAEADDAQAGAHGPLGAELEDLPLAA